MNNSDVVFKTSHGAEELRSRALGLKPRLRTVLVLVDGVLSVGQLEVVAASLGAPSDVLVALHRDGLVETRSALRAAMAPTPAAWVAAAPAAPVSDAERFRSTQKFMNDTVVDAIGLRAFLFTLKLEKCYTCADLQLLLPEFAAKTIKGNGDVAGRMLESRARQMLG